MVFLESRLTSVGTLGPGGVAPHPVIDCAKRGPVKQTSIAALTPVHSAADLDGDVARLVTSAYSSQHNRGAGAQSTWIIAEKSRSALDVARCSVQRRVHGAREQDRRSCRLFRARCGDVVDSLGMAVATVWED